jgi:thioredoxin reductase
MDKIYDVMIVGGGPAGIAAGIYGARKRVKTLFLTFDFGGQSTVSSSVENWIGVISITGSELGQRMKAHLEHYRGEFLDIVDRVKVTKIERTAGGFKAIAQNGQTFEAKTALITTGSKRRKLTVPGAAEFEGKGIVYCASCDAPLFDGQDVAVIGGGNAGFGTASQLTAYAKHITVIEQGRTFRAEQITVDKLLQDPKVSGMTGVEITGVKGEKFVTGLAYRDQTGDHELPVGGIFVEIGNVPNAEAVSGLLALNPAGAIITDPRTQRTSVEGVWAAGDCTDSLYHQNNIAAGDGVVAMEDIYNYLSKQ